MTFGVILDWGITLVLEIVDVPPYALVADFICCGNRLAVDQLAIFHPFSDYSVDKNEALDLGLVFYHYR